MQLLSSISKEEDITIEYEKYRLNQPNKYMFLNKFVEKFFNGSLSKLIETLQHYNHKIKSIESVEGLYDVYDLEVPETHNFALATGVFVHNSCKMGRERQFQAILPLRGKVLNTETATLKKLLENEELTNIVSALGCGIGKDYDEGKLRYHKIILLADADFDGSHITTLLLTFFYRHMPGIIKGGHLYLGQPPLYRIDVGQTTHWAADDKEKEKILKKIKSGKSEITRFKGLGEMPPKVLYETTLNPAKRRLLKIVIPDGTATITDQVMSDMMGKDAAPRLAAITAKLGDIDHLDA